MRNETIVTVDGPASSGKTTTGLSIAKKLNFRFVDSGQLYRAGCHYLLKNELKPKSDVETAKIFQELDIQIISTDCEQIVYVNGIDVTAELDNPVVTKIVPYVGSGAEVRRVVKTRQQAFGVQGEIVMAGRDIGTDIFPDALHKFYLTASPEARTRRRLSQQIGKGHDTSLEALFIQLQERDNLDTSRTTSPLRKAENAVLIDTTSLPIDSVVGIMYDQIVFNMKQAVNVDINI